MRLVSLPQNTFPHRSRSNPDDGGVGAWMCWREVPGGDHLRARHHHRCHVGTPNHLSRCLAEGMSHRLLWSLRTFIFCIRPPRLLHYTLLVLESIYLLLHVLYVRINPQEEDENFRVPILVPIDLGRASLSPCH